MEAEIVKRNIIQPIDMTLAKHNFNVFEKRVIYRVLEALQDEMVSNVPNLFGDITVNLRTRSLMTKNSFNRSHIYKALKRLKHISFDVTGEDEIGKYDKDVSVIKDFKLYKNKELVHIEIDQHLSNYYLEKARGFTPYNLEVSFNSSSAYTMKMYELLSHWREKGGISHKRWSIKYLSEYFNVPESYKRYSKLVEKIFAPAAKELNNNPGSDLIFKFSGIKRGRSYNKVLFEIADTAHKKNYTGKEFAEEIVLNGAINGLLTKYFKFRAKDFADIKHVLSNKNLNEAVFEIIDDIKIKVDAGEIEYPKAYIKTSIKNLIA